MSGEMNWVDSIKQCGGYVTKSSQGITVSLPSADSLNKVAQILTNSDGPGFSMLIDFYAHQNHGNCQNASDYSLVYQMYSPGEELLLSLTVGLKNGEKIISLKKHWPSIAWMELEAFEMYGIPLADDQREHHLFFKGESPFPLRKEYRLQ